MSASRRLLPATALVPLLITGCSSPAGEVAPSGASSSARALSGSITVFAAASLTDSFTTLGRRFEAAHRGTTVKFSFAASSALAQQITSGAPADVFASASTKNMKQVVSAGEARAPKEFAGNVAEVAVAPGSAGRVRSLADLAEPGVKVALCQPEVPCGALARSVLANAGVTVTPVTRGLDVKAVLATVSSGEVDAGIVYVTDVRAAGSRVTGVVIPAAVNASTAYPIATMTDSRNAALAEAFEAYVLSPDGQRVLNQAGYARP